MACMSSSSAEEGMPCFIFIRQSQVRRGASDVAQCSLASAKTWLTSTMRDYQGDFQIRRHTPGASLPRDIATQSWHDAAWFAV